MSTLIRWEPGRELTTLRERMDRLFNEALRSWGLAEEGLTSGVWLPPVDVIEKGDSIIMKADLPDVKRDDVEISVHDGTLTIKGERKMEKELTEQNFYRRERSYGSFTRSFTLPPTVDPEKIEATFDSGVLTLTLPKHEESKPKQIKVKVGSGK